MGTISPKNQKWFKALTKAGIKHNVLNAKFHASEADIVAQAGYPSAVTIATNTWRAVIDIMPGGSQQAEVAQLEDPTPNRAAQIKADWAVFSPRCGALSPAVCISSGPERHESRRIDNQLRGCSGRRGCGFFLLYLSMKIDAHLRV